VQELGQRQRRYNEEEAHMMDVSEGPW
jgi:hypothetical protein